MRFHHGHHSGNADNEEDTDLITVSAGWVGGRIVAVGRFRFTPPATGFSDEAHAFLIAGGHATWLRELGGFAYFNDSGPGVDPWILVSFRNDRLYADVWNTQTRCERSQREPRAGGERGGRSVPAFRRASYRSSRASHG